MLDSVGEFFYKRRSQGLPGLSWPWQPFLPGYAQVAQLVEQWTENPRVGGSIPPLGTIISPYKINKLEGIVRLTSVALSNLQLEGLKLQADATLPRQRLVHV